MFEFVKCFYTVVGALFVIYLLGYSTFLIASVIAGSLDLYKESKKRRYHNEISHDYYVPVSIVVPAYNEEVTVVDTVKSLLMMDYRLYEIVVVDDGSKDATTQVLLDAFHLKKVMRPINRQIKCRKEQNVYEAVVNGINITLVQKINGGKADALNMGINASRYPYFICMDADSILQHDSLEKIVRPVLEDENVIAVGGSVRPANGVVIKKGHVIKYRLPRNIIARMQSLEYDRSFLAARILLDKINANMIISGAFGLFEKKTVIAVGGYDSSTMGEDMELVVRLHEFSRMNRKPYKIDFAQDAICWSQTPEKLSELGKQRKRWQRGLFQCMWGHRKMLANPRYGAVGLLSYIYFLFYELLSPFIELFGILTMVLSVMMDMLNVKFMLVFLACYALYGILLTLTAYFSRIYTIDQRLSFRELSLAITACFFETTFLRFYLAFVRVTAFVGYKKNKLNWGKLERKKMNGI